MPGSETDARQYLTERFGVDPSVLEDFRFIERNEDVWLAGDSVPERIETETEGFRVLRLRSQGYKPTTYALQFFDTAITAHRVEISREELESLITGDMIERSFDEHGYVALVHDGRVIGCGYYKDDLVSSRIPKGRAKTLATFIGLDIDA